MLIPVLSPPLPGAKQALRSKRRMSGTRHMQRNEVIMKYEKIMVYLLASYGFSWMVWLPFLINHRWNERIPTFQSQFYLASFGPLIGAVLASLASGGWKELKDWFRRTYSLRFPMRWLIMAVLMPVLYAAAAIVIQRFITGEWTEWSRFGLTGSLPGLNIMQTALVWIVTFGLGEESGWRGFLLPELSKRFSLRVSALIVAVIWMLWHLPAFLFHETYMNMGPGVIGWAVSLCFGSILLAWLCKKSRFSVLPALVWHGGFNLITAGDTSAEMVAAICSVLVIVQGAVLIGRLGRNRA